MKSESGRMDALTGLRFVAAFWVLLYHFTPHLLAGAPGPLLTVISSGDLGVDVFFVLSGFVLAVVYLDNGRGLSPAPFWRARLARIYPLFVVSLVVAVLVAALTGSSFDVLSTLPVLGLAQSWGSTPMLWNSPGWSLSVEALFYLLFPFIGAPLTRLSKRGLVIVLSFTWLAGLAATLFAQHIAPDMWPGWLYTWPPLHVHEFVVGMCAGLLYRRDNSLRGAWLSVAAALGLLVAIARLAGVSPVIHNGFFSPLVAMLVIGLARGGGPLAWLLSRRYVVRLGEASYAVYILQEPLWFAWRDIFGVAPSFPGDWAMPVQPAWVILTFVPALIAAAFVAHVFIERPARRLIMSARLPRLKLAAPRLVVAGFRPAAGSAWRDVAPWALERGRAHRSG